MLGLDTFASAGGQGVRTVQIDGGDIATIVIYFVLVMGIGVYVSTSITAIIL